MDASRILLLQDYGRVVGLNNERSMDCIKRELMKTLKQRLTFNDSPTAKSTYAIFHNHAQRGSRLEHIYVIEEMCFRKDCCLANVRRSLKRLSGVKSGFLLAVEMK